ncbi:MAG: lipopolysaccharide assembly LapA domain-containing protein [Betaproteobacteria bacterium]
MGLLGWLIRLAFFGFVLWFALKNTTPVPLRLTETLAYPAVPLVVIILGCFVLGVLAAAAALATRLFRLRRQVAGLQATAAQPARAAVDAAQQAYGDELASAARNAGAAGQLDADTRFPRL